MPTPLTPEDFEASLPGIDAARIQEAISEAWALAIAKVPCLASITDEDKIEAVKAILKRAIRYDLTTGANSITTQTAGPYMQVIDNKSRTSSMLFSADQINELRALCDAEDTVRALEQGSHSLKVRSTMSAGRQGWDRIRNDRFWFRRWEG